MHDTELLQQIDVKDLLGCNDLADLAESLDSQAMLSVNDLPVKDLFASPSRSIARFDL